MIFATHFADADKATRETMLEMAALAYWSKIGRESLRLRDAMRIFEVGPDPIVQSVLDNRYLGIYEPSDAGARSHWHPDTVIYPREERLKMAIYAYCASTFPSITEECLAARDPE